MKIKKPCNKKLKKPCNKKLEEPCNKKRLSEQEELKWRTDQAYDGLLAFGIRIGGQPGKPTKRGLSLPCATTKPPRKPTKLGLSRPCATTKPPRKRAHIACKIRIGGQPGKPTKRGLSLPCATTKPPRKREHIARKIESHEAFNDMEKLDAHRRVFQRLLEVTMSKRSPGKMIAHLRQMFIALNRVQQDLWLNVPTSATSKKIHDVDAVMLDISKAIHACEKSTTTMAELCCGDSKGMLYKDMSVEQQIKAMQLRVVLSSWHKKPMSDKLLTATKGIISENKTFVKTMANLKRWVKLKLSDPSMWAHSNGPEPFSVVLKVGV